MFWIVFLYKPFWWRPCTALVTTFPDLRTVSESASFLHIPYSYHLPYLAFLIPKTLTHCACHAMILIDCWIIFRFSTSISKDQTLMVILSYNCRDCITSSFKEKLKTRYVRPGTASSSGVWVLMTEYLIMSWLICEGHDRAEFKFAAVWCLQPNLQ